MFLGHPALGSFFFLPFAVTHSFGIPPSLCSLGSLIEAHLEKRLREFYHVHRTVSILVESVHYTA